MKRSPKDVAKQLKDMKFATLGIEGSLLAALDEIGYEQPTSIQAQAIPEVLAGQDILGIAQTGTGKTAAFALPIMQALLTGDVKANRKCPKVLILSPTRELAGQIRDEIARYGKRTTLRHACIFGGVGQRPQEKVLIKGVELLVATPGRLLDLAHNRHVDLREVSHLVLDEADRLLDMGFIRDVRKIIRMLPKKRQSLLFSATMPEAVSKLAADILINPVRIDVSPKAVTVDKIDQRVVMVDGSRKQKTLESMLFDPEVTRAIVFTRTKHGANRVAKHLDKAGISAEAIHGNKSQNARTRALANFKNGDAWVLVATDIAARGIDIQGVSHVINFELPHEPESYVHRIGRTARAGASGVAWSLVDAAEVKRLRAIERLTKVRLKHLDLPGVEQDSQVHTEAEQSNGEQARQDTGSSGKRRRRRPRRKAA